MNERIICDSREKKNQHILAFFERCEVPYIIRKMNVADYQIEGRDNLVIDRKKDLNELCTNLTSPKDKSRFWKEVRRAKENGIKMIVLCEHGGKIKQIEDVKHWHSKYSTVSGRALMEKIYQVHISYGVEFLFCDKRSTARKILELLKYE